MTRLGGIDLNLLVVLDALLEARSVTAAAKQLGLSQSATSHALARLRALTGDPLFVRTARELVPTARALALRAPIRAALTHIETALGEPQPFDPSTAVGALRIAAIDLAQNVLIPPLSRQLASAAPGIDVVVLPYDEDITRALADGVVDLAVGLSRSLPQLRQSELLRDRFVCAVRRDHPCLTRRLTATRYAKLGHVIITPRGQARGFVDRALAERKLERRVVLAVPSFATAALAVASSDLVLTVSERVALALRGALPIALIDPPLSLPRITVSMTWHARSDADPLQRWLRDTLLATAAA